MQKVKASNSKLLNLLEWSESDLPLLQTARASIIYIIFLKSQIIPVDVYPPLLVASGSASGLAYTKDHAMLRELTSVTEDHEAQT